MTGKTPVHVAGRSSHLQDGFTLGHVGLLVDGGGGGSVSLEGGVSAGTRGGVRAVVREGALGG